MLAIAITFPAGRFHATPWGRHVNEAAVAWPPEPLRLFRALIAVWHRKLGPAAHPRERLASLLARMAQAPAPRIRVPEDAIHGHTRHYMPARQGKTTLVFDAFARLAPDDPIVFGWPELQLPAAELRLLDELLAGLSYFGRAESWAIARRCEWAGGFNCLPAAPAAPAVDDETGEILGEIVRLEVPLAPEDYRTLREQRLGREARPAARLRKSLPEDWLDAIGADTADFQAAGWNKPPAARAVPYRRPAGALPAVARRPPPPASSAPSTTRPTTARFALYGKPLPRIERAVRVGEAARVAAMAVSRYLFGPDRLPPELSGHFVDTGGGVHRHPHAFWLPEPNPSGEVDHLVVHAPGGFSEDALLALHAIRFLRSEDGDPLRVMLEDVGALSRFADAGSLVGESAVWRSVTPYLHPWHLKARDMRSPEAVHSAVQGQLQREWQARADGLAPIIEVLPVDEVQAGGRALAPVHFHRFRKKRGLVQPDTLGRFVQLRFERPVRGPVALGFGCHFGLGLFAPLGDSVV
ncbi:type I-U CRISPR-associated protein Csb2 [Rubrivivax sp. JA1026]|uniref:type I-G CRISPR-associated protein Csb2 n=1 Tax=Rubrivivax sp. JA1026 TaxID=2710888 RepID=UPI0013E92C02|nr:type I-U CRISPR-associated protein Csb2 [Rubrivivax sp. JA1026]